MSYDANLLIAEDGVLARLAPDATKKFRLATSESGPEEDNVHIPSTGDSKSLKRKIIHMTRPLVLQHLVTID